MNDKKDKDFKHLKKSTYNRTQRWAIDQDYMDKLSEDEKAWLNKFNQEYYKAEFRENPIHTDEGHIEEAASRNYRIENNEFLIESNYEREDTFHKVEADILDELIDAKRKDGEVVDIIDYKDEFSKRNKK